MHPPTPKGVGAGVRVVSAWASPNRLVLGQVATDAKSNEITANPELLRLLDLKGCTPAPTADDLAKQDRVRVVTIDAAGTQTAIAEQIVAAEGDYTCPNCVAGAGVLALKGNQ